MNGDNLNSSWNDCLNSSYDPKFVIEVVPTENVKMRKYRGKVQTLDGAAYLLLFDFFLLKVFESGFGNSLHEYSTNILKELIKSILKQLELKFKKSRLRAFIFFFWMFPQRSLQSALDFCWCFCKIIIINLWKFSWYLRTIIFYRHFYHISLKYFYISSKKMLYSDVCAGIWNVEPINVDAVYFMVKMVTRQDFLHFKSIRL